MPLNIKNGEVETLVADLARMTGETKTEVVRRALEERRARLMVTQVVTDPAARFRAMMEEEVWPLVPPEERGRVMSRQEEEALLGYGVDGA